jgi:signal peptidase I
MQFSVATDSTLDENNKCPPIPGDINVFNDTRILVELIRITKVIEQVHFRKDNNNDTPYAVANHLLNCSKLIESHGFIRRFGINVRS